MWYPEQLVKSSGQIDRIDKPSKDEFKRYVAGSTPVIVGGALDGQKAWLTWTSQYLKNSIGETECEVCVCKAGQFAGADEPNPNHDQHYRFAKMKLSECIERMSTPEQTTPIFWTNERYALYRVPARAFAPILTDLVIPEFIPYGRSIDESNLWISQAGNITLPHSDFSENVLTQIRGRKEILLWDPSQWSNLYLNHLGATHARQSQVDITKPDVARFPLFAQARALRGALEAGDALFIPFGYIHCVYSDTFSISVNYWWGGRSFARIRRVLMSPLVSYCGQTPWVAFKLLGEGALRRLSDRTNVPQDNKAPSIIDTAVRRIK